MKGNLNLKYPELIVAHSYPQCTEDRQVYLYTCIYEWQLYSLWNHIYVDNITA